jgi:hypothetical protein
MAAGGRRTPSPLVGEGWGEGAVNQHRRGQPGGFGFDVCTLRPSTSSGRTAFTQTAYSPPRSFTSLRAHPLAKVMRSSAPISNCPASDTTPPFASCTRL